MYFKWDSLPSVGVNITLEVTSGTGVLATGSEGMVETK